MDMNFNQQGEKPKFIYSREDGNARCYAISMFKDYKGPEGLYEQVGTYEIVDESEAETLSEKKISNLMLALAKRENLEDLSAHTETRLLFNVAPRTDEQAPTVVTFRTYDGSGVSVDNAVLKIEKGVLNESR